MIDSLTNPDSRPTPLPTGLSIGTSHTGSKPMPRLIQGDQRPYIQFVEESPNPNYDMRPWQATDGNQSTL